MAKAKSKSFDQRYSVRSGRQMQDLEPDSAMDERAKSIMKKSGMSPTEQVENMANRRATRNTFPTPEDDTADPTKAGYHNLSKDEQ